MFRVKMLTKCRLNWLCGIFHFLSTRSFFSDARRQRYALKWKHYEHKKQALGERVTSLKDIRDLKNNFVQCGTGCQFINSEIVFKGRGNRLLIDDAVILKDSRIVFSGNNSAVYLGGSKFKYFLKASLNHNNALYIGKNNFFNGPLTVICSEETNVVIGDDCLFSKNIWIRTADPHLIYDMETHKRINPSRSVLVGDHVWIGQNSLILKGTTVGSGSIVGGGSVVSGKKIPSNTCWGGAPARLIRTKIFWSGECVHHWTSVYAKKFDMMNTDKWIYTEEPEDFLSLNSILPTELVDRVNMSNRKNRFLLK